MLHILSRHGDEDANLAWDLIEQMEREGVTGNISTINLLIGMVGAHGVNRCMEMVKKWGLRLNGYTYKCIVQAYIRGRDVEQGFRVYDEMKRKGYKLDIFAYNMLLHALAQASMVCFLSLSSSF
jgi:pentatricopeptide repeat protein